MTHIVERLDGLTTTDQFGDWMDVVARAERRRAVDLRRRALIAVAALLLLAVPALALAHRLGGFLVVSNERSEPAGPWIAGNRLHNLGDIDDRRLAAPLAWYPSPPLFNTPAAVPSPDRRLLLYRAAEPPERFPWETTPVLRVHDLESGRDRIVELGVGSFALRPDGALAYAQGDADFSNHRHPGGPLGHVFVRASISEPPVRWTSERARYTVLAWARRTLLVSTIPDNALIPPQGAAVYALSGPGRARKLPIGGVVAIDQAGELVAGPIGLDPYVVEGLTLRIVSVRDARVISELDLAPVVAREAPHAAAYGLTGGSWGGSYIVLTVPSAGEELRDALVVLRYDGSLRPVHVFKLEPDSAAESGFASAPNAFHSPRLLDEEGLEIVAWAGITERDGRDVFLASVFLRCDRTKRGCRRTDALPGTRYRITGQPEPFWGPPVQSVVQNPSRPLPEP